MEVKLIQENDTVTGDRCGFCRIFIHVLLTHNRWPFSGENEPVRAAGQEASQEAGKH